MPTDPTPDDLAELRAAWTRVDRVLTGTDRVEVYPQTDPVPSMAGWKATNQLEGERAMLHCAMPKLLARLAAADARAEAAESELARRREDEGDKAWVDALEPLGFKYTACGTAMHFTYGTWSVLVTGDFGHAEGWDKPTGLALEVSFATAAGKVTPHLSIMDDPTVGDVKRLLAALALPTPVPGE